MHNVEFTFNIWSNMKHKKVLKYSLCVCVCVPVLHRSSAVAAL